MLKYQGSDNHNVQTTTKNPSRTTKLDGNYAPLRCSFSPLVQFFFLPTINSKWDNNNIPFRFVKHCLASNAKTNPLTSHMPRKELVPKE